MYTSTFVRKIRAFNVDEIDGWSISPIFYSKLLRLQIPKAQKIQSNHKSFFALLGSEYIKAAHKLLMKLTLEASSSLLREGKKAE